MTSVRLARACVALIAASALVIGLSGGLARLGLVPPVIDAAEHHGALMICGFFGTMIALERAVAVGFGAALLVPGLAALGAALLALGLVPQAAAAFLAAGVGLLAITGASIWARPTLFMVVMTVAAALWPIGTAWWMAGASVGEATWPWLGFLVLTIVAERIELSRLAAPGPVARASLVVAVSIFIAAVLAGQPWAGSAVLAVALAALALWLLANDVAVMTVRTRGLARFAAVCLLLGYGWLLITAVTLLLLPPATTAFGHDAAVHTVAVGFVLSMVFAHAPVILPAVVGVRVRYLPTLYVPVVVLQIGVAARLLGDFAQSGALVAAGAWLTVAALLVYAGILAATALANGAATRQRAGEPARLEGPDL